MHWSAYTILYISEKRIKIDLTIKRNTIFFFVKRDLKAKKIPYFYIFVLEFCFVQWNVIAILLNCILHHSIFFFVQKLAIIDIWDIRVVLFCSWIFLRLYLFSLNRKAFKIKHKNTSLITFLYKQLTRKSCLYIIL